MAKKSNKVLTVYDMEVQRRANNPNGKKMPWDRLTDEPAAHYEWFRTYRDLGPPPNGRSLDGMAQKLGFDQSNGNYDRLSVKYCWAERARLYDLWCIDKQSEAENKAIQAKAQEIAEDWGERQAKLRELQYKVGYGFVKAAMKRVLLAEGVDEEGNEVEAQPFKMADKDYGGLAKAGAALMAQAIAPPKQGVSEDDEFANMPSDPSEWSEKDLLRYKARTAQTEEVG
jgi:hypothetical protein